MGHIRLMSLVLFAISIRMLGYSLLEKPVWVLPIELINGFAFSMCYVVIASYSNVIARVGTESTIQALFSALFDGLGEPLSAFYHHYSFNMILRKNFVVYKGISFGGFLAGTIYHRFGGRFLFRFFGYVSIVVGLLHVFTQHKFNPESKINSRDSRQLNGRC